MFQKLFLLLVAFGILPITVWAQKKEQPIKLEDRYHIVHDFKYDWQVYDARYKIYVPYLREKHGLVSSAGISLDLQQFSGFSLIFKPESEIYLFVDATLQQRYDSEQWAVLSVDSLSKIFRQPVIFITFYSPVAQLPLPVTFIGHPKNEVQVTTTPIQSSLTAQPRSISSFRDFLILASVFLLASYAFLRNLHPNAFSRFYSLKGLFLLNYRDEPTQISKPLNGINLLFLLNHGLLLSLLFMLIREGGRRLLFPAQVLRLQTSLSDYLFNFVIVGLLIFLLLVLKYLTTYLLGKLFRFEKLINVHFFEYLRFSKVFYTLLVPVLILVFTSYPAFVYTVDDVGILLIIGFSFVRIILISFSLNQLAPHRILYLFSYLCVTELVPLLAGIKILLG